MRGWTAGLTAVVAVVAAAPADAATLTRSGTTVVYAGEPGEANRPMISMISTSDSGPMVAFQDVREIRPGAGCGRLSAESQAFTCGPGIARVVLRLGDSNDEMLQPGNVAPIPAGATFTVDAGPGDDRITGTKVGGDQLNGEAGNDTIHGAGGRDVLSGGAGKDRLTAYGRLSGGPGNDWIGSTNLGVGPQLPSRIFAGPGKDNVLSGNNRRDVIDCGPGYDVATTTDQRGRDRFRSCEWP
jgi:hypothetical protein